jgi:hypothetical protein
MSDSLTSAPDVAAEIAGGEGLSLPQAARLLPSYRAGKPVNSATIWRWITSGIRLPDGTHLRLEACRLSGRWLTSRQALQRFIEGQTPARGAVQPAFAGTPGRRRKAAERAGAELTKAGI